jgi:hypothetical protein
MSDNLVKPIEMTVPVVGVGQKPMRQTNQLVQRKIAPPLNLSPPVKKSIAKPNFATRSDVEVELEEINKAWRKYRSIKDRDAVYIYLASVFGLVMRWRLLDCALKKSRAALRLRPNPPQMKAEAFSIMIFCTADPNVVDAKTRSKWSRVLRYAARAKPADQRLTDFVKSNGGLNECARKFARVAG